MGLVLRPEGLVGTPVRVEYAGCCVTHDGILGFVGAFKHAFQRFQLLFREASLQMEDLLLLAGRTGGAPRPASSPKPGCQGIRRSTTTVSSLMQDNRVCVCVCRGVRVVKGAYHI